MASWYRRFIPKFLKILAPLRTLLRNKQRWKWETEQESAFKELKKSLTETPVLAPPDFSKRFILETDASNEGLGAALIQEGENGCHVISYASRSLNDAEKNYSVTEK